VFPVRFELNVYILLIINPVFNKGLHNVRMLVIPDQLCRTINSCYNKTVLITSQVSNILLIYLRS
jgi:hypothetical protein